MPNKKRKVNKATRQPADHLRRAYDRGLREGVAQTKAAHSHTIEQALVNAHSRLLSGYTETVIREVVRLLLGDAVLPENRKGRK